MEPVKKGHPLWEPAVRSWLRNRCPRTMVIRDWTYEVYGNDPDEVFFVPKGPLSGIDGAYGDQSMPLGEHEEIRGPM